MDTAVLDKEKRLQLVGEDEKTGLKVYLFRPTLFRALYKDLYPSWFARRIRFAYEYLHKGHYSVYYAALGNTIIADSVIAPGGRRLTCTSPSDGVTGPTFVLEEYRNRGYNKAMKKIIFAHCGFKDIYCWVQKDNLPSRASLEKYGFVPCGEVRDKGLLKKQVPCENGTAIVYRYTCN